MPVAVSLVSSSLYTDVVLFLFSFFSKTSASARASAECEKDESLTWWWQDNRLSANGNLLFVVKASFSCSQRCLPTVYFLLPPPLPPCAGGQSIRCGFFLSRALEGLRRENRGSVNWLGEFTSSTKPKIEHFHAIVAQQRQKIYVKKCAAVFLSFSLPSPSSSLKPPDNCTRRR